MRLYKALLASFTVVASLGTASWADMITPDGRTNTSVIQSGSVHDVYTGTVRGRPDLTHLARLTFMMGMWLTCILPMALKT